MQLINGCVFDLDLLAVGHGKQPMGRGIQLGKVKGERVLYNLGLREVQYPIFRVGRIGMTCEAPFSHVGRKDVACEGRERDKGLGMTRHVDGQAAQESGDQEEEDGEEEEQEVR